MKRLRIFSILLLLVSIALFLVFQMYSKVVRDNNPPKVTCESEEIKVSVEAKTEDLLKGVSAKDGRSGDVTDTLVIEEMSAFTEDGTRIITYAAVDGSKNVGRCERVLKYTDYKAPRFKMNGSLCFQMGANVNVFNVISAESALDGDLSKKIKYALEKTINTMSEGSYPIEFRVMDSGGKMAYLNTEIEILSRDYSGIKVMLTDYLVYVKKGSSFNASNYYRGADREGQLTIKSEVDTGKSGTYYVDYIVKNGSIGGKSRLVVVVE